MKLMKNAGNDAGEGIHDYMVPAVEKAVRVLSLLKNEGRELTATEIADAMKWHKGSLHRLLGTLCHYGLIDRDDITKRYALGVALLEYGRAVVKGLNIIQVAGPFLQALTDYSGETAALALLRRTKIIIIGAEESPNPMRVSLSIGMEAPATTTSNGKAVLAYLPESRIREIIRIEGLPNKRNKSIAGMRAYQKELASVRKRGYAIDCGEYQEWIVGVSAPIFDVQGQVIGALSIVGPQYRVTQRKIRNYGKKCAEMTTQLSNRLRWSFALPRP